MTVRGEERRGVSASVGGVGLGWGDLREEGRGGEWVFGGGRALFVVGRGLL